MKAILYGQHARSDNLVGKTRDYDRKRISLEELQTVQAQECASFLAAQRDYPYLSSGLFHWDDLIRPFRGLIRNAGSGALTRFYESNTFWRTLEVNEPFVLEEEKIAEWITHCFQPAARPVFTLPFLYLLQDFSRGVALDQLAFTLKAIAKELNKYNDGILIFYEPTFGWRPITPKERHAGIQLLEEIKNCCQLPIAIMQNFFSVKHEIQHLHALPIDGIGFDFYHNAMTETLEGFPPEKFLLAGVLNTDSPLPEDKEQLSSFLDAAAGFIPKENLYLTTSGPAEFLPRQVIDNKIRHLSEILS